MSLNITFLEGLLHLPGANELIKKFYEVAMT